MFLCESPSNTLRVSLHIFPSSSRLGMFSMTLSLSWIAGYLTPATNRLTMWTSYHPPLSSRPASVANFLRASKNSPAVSSSWPLPQKVFNLCTASMVSFLSWLRDLFTTLVNFASYCNLIEVKACFSSSILLWPADSLLQTSLPGTANSAQSLLRQSNTDLLFSTVFFLISMFNIYFSITICIILTK